MGFEKIIAAYQLCADYHGGQWSRGYRIMCKLQEKYKMEGDFLSRGMRESVEFQYRELLAGTDLDRL